MKLTTARPYADPETAARKLVELAKSIEAVQDGRIYIERINAPFLFTHKASGPEFGAGLRFAIEKGWLDLHESGIFVRLLRRGRICWHRHHCMPGAGSTFGERRLKGVGCKTEGPLLCNGPPGFQIFRNEMVVTSPKCQFLPSAEFWPQHMWGRRCASRSQKV